MLQQDHEHHELKSPYCSFILSGVPGGCQKSKHSPTVPRSLLQNPEAEGKHLFLPKKGGGDWCCRLKEAKGPSFEQLKFISLRSLLGILDDFQRLQMNPNSPSVEGYSGLNQAKQPRPNKALGGDFGESALCIAMTSISIFTLGISQFPSYLEMGFLDTFFGVFEEDFSELSRSSKLKNPKWQLSRVRKV